MANNRKPAAAAAAAAVVAEPTPPTYDLGAIDNLIAFALKRSEWKDDFYWQVAKEAGPNGIPADLIEGRFDGIDRSDAKLRTVMDNIEVALRIGKKLHDFIDHAKTEKEKHPGITISASAWAFKVGRARIEAKNGNLSDAELWDRVDVTNRTPDERAAAFFKRAHGLGEEGLSLDGTTLTDEEREDMAAALATLEALRVRLSTPPEKKAA